MHKARWMAGAVVIAAAGFTWGMTGASSSDRDQVPVVEDGPKGHEDVVASLPDRIPVSYRDREGSPGTISKDDYLAEREAPLEVRDDSGTLVGHLHPGVGFVSLEESAAPGFDPAEHAIVTTTVVGP